VANPSETCATEYKRLCGYIRMELVLLIERLHCIYVKAFSMQDCRTKWWRFGKPWKDYVEKIEKDPLTPYIHWQCFSEYWSLQLSKIDNLISRQNVSSNFIQGAQYPAFWLPFYLDQDRAYQLITALVKNNHYINALLIAIFCLIKFLLWTN
jgi:hypothetical protein